MNWRVVNQKSTIPCFSTSSPERRVPSLAHARAKAADLPIQWVEADVRDFHLDRRFKLIFARGGVFNFLLTRVDQEAMLACVREHLADDGQFMVDLCHKTPSDMTDVPVETEWFTLTHPNERQIVVSGTDHFDFSNQLWTQICYERWDGPEGELLRTPTTLILRYVMPQEMEALLHYNGFKVAEKYADYGGTPGTAEEPATLFICEKR